jgi:DNA polymerase-3 subunit delta'
MGRKAETESTHVAGEEVGGPLFSRVIGQKVVCSYLRRAIKNQRVTHAYLFTGPAGVGKDAVALDFAAALLCDKYDTESEHAPCRTCPQCRLTARLEHPDLHILAPLPGKTSRDRLAEEAKRASALDVDDEKTQGAAAREEEEGPISEIVDKRLMAAIAEKAKEPYMPILLPRALSILIWQIRALINNAYRQPFQARRKVFIITQADRMNLNAQNAFLKALEEPPEDTHFFLTCELEGNLLETIRSRCQRIVFPPIAEADIEEALRARLPEFKESAGPISRLASGNFWQALELSKMDWKEMQSAAADYMGACAEGSFDPMKLDIFYEKVLSEESGRPRILLGILLLFLNDAALLKGAHAGGQDARSLLALPDLRKDGERRAERLVKSFPQVQPEQAVLAIHTAVSQLERGYTPRSVLTALSFQLHHALGHRRVQTKAVRSAEK